MVDRLTKNFYKWKSLYMEITILSIDCLLDLIKKVLESIFSLFNAGALKFWIVATLYGDSNLRLFEGIEFREANK